MAKRTKKPGPVYEILAITINNYKASVDAAINYEARDKRYFYKNPSVHSFGTNIELEGVCTYPDDRAGENYSITIYGHEREHGEFSKRLSDYQERDEKYNLKYRTVRGNQVPVYDVPYDIGYYSRNRGTKDWSGAAWVSPQTASDMLVLLSSVNPLYVSIHECKIGRNRLIAGLTLQTTDPAYE